MQTQKEEIQGSLIVDMFDQNEYSPETNDKKVNENQGSEAQEDEIPLPEVLHP